MTPFLKRLRESRPSARIGMVVGSEYADLLRAWPWVDEWIVQNKREQARTPWVLRRFLKKLRAPEWDVAFEMSNHNTHSYSSCLMTILSGAPHRIGFDERRNEATLTVAVSPAAAVGSTSPRPRFTCWVPSGFGPRPMPCGVRFPPRRSSPPGSPTSSCTSGVGATRATSRRDVVVCPRGRARLLRRHARAGRGTAGSRPRAPSPRARHRAGTDGNRRSRPLHRRRGGVRRL